MSTVAGGIDLLNSPYGACTFYVGDTVPRQSTRTTEVLRSIDKMGTLIPQKSTVRREIINNAVGFLTRYSTFITDYLNKNLIVPVAAVAADPNSPDGLGMKLNNVLNQNEDLRKQLDDKDGTMVQAIAAAWSQDQNAVTDAAGKAAVALKRTEEEGVKMVNAEMSSMYRAANKAVRDDAKDISALARNQILQVNSSANEVNKTAYALYTASQGIMTKANALFANMADTQKVLDQAQGNTTARYAQIEGDVNKASSANFLTAQGLITQAQLHANAGVDTTLQKVASDIAKALTSLTDAETRNLTAMSTTLNRNLAATTKTITDYGTDASRRAGLLQANYTRALTQTANSANALFSNADSAITDINNGVTATNSSLVSTRSSMTSQFAALDNQVKSLFGDQAQAATVAKAQLDSWMDSTLSTFKDYSLNSTRSGSTDLKNAFAAALASVTTGADSLSLTFEQRQQVVAALMAWQGTYKGNTDKMVTAFSNTYSTLISDTSSQLSSAVADEKARIDAATNAQIQMVNDAIASAQGDPSKLQQILAKFGLVGDRAAAAAQRIQARMNQTGSSIGQGIGDGMAALQALTDAANATSDTYKAAAAANDQAALVAHAAVTNVTIRIGTMNELLKQYSGKISSLLFNATTDAQDAVSQAASAANGNVTASVNSRMSQLQAKLAQVLAGGHASAADLAAFAASVGANATALTDLVNSLQSDSSDGLSSIAGVSKDAIDSLKSGVAAQVAAVSADFSSQLDAEKNSVADLVESMRNDLTTQSGSKSQLLLQRRDQLQALFASLTSSATERDLVMKSLNAKFNDAEKRVSVALPQMDVQITASRSKVSQAFQDKYSQLVTASQAVNDTIADTNATAAQGLVELKKAGDSRVAAVQSTLDDTAGAVSMMVQRYENLMAKYVDSDRAQRVQENSDQLARILGVNSTLDDAKKAQDAALAARQAEALKRAVALAGMVADLSGAQGAAASGQTAFRAYIQALADKTGVNMADLVNAMKTQVGDNKSKLYKLLQDNGLFVNDTLGKLATDADLLQQGVLDGTGDVMANMQGALNRSAALSASQDAAFSNLSSQSNQVNAITGSQLAELMTILLAQADLNADASNQTHSAALQRTATVSDALAISVQAMYEATNSTQDALAVAGNATDDIDQSTQARVKDATDATNEDASEYTDAATADYQALSQAIAEADSFKSVFTTKLQNVQKSWQDAKPDIEQQVGKLKDDVSALEKTADSNKQSEIDRVNNWASNIEAASLTQLANIQSQTVKVPIASI